MPKTYSQKIARGFELLGYIYFLSLGWLLLASRFHPFVLSLQISAGFLLTGFFLHSRGRLETRWFGVLWIGNFIFYLVFTIIFILFSLWLMFWLIGTKSSEIGLFILFLLLIGTGLLACLFFTFIGLGADSEENAKNR